MARSKSPKMTCPQCGAKNDVDIRRCRVCAALINTSAEDLSSKPKGLPEHVQRQIDKTIAAQSDRGSEPFAEPDLVDLPPPPPPPPPSPPPQPSYDPPPVDENVPAGDVIEFDVMPRNPGLVPEPVEMYEASPAAEEHFDPNALFADMDPVLRPDLPPPPTPPQELVYVPVERVDPFEGIGAGIDRELTSEEIEQMTAEAIKNERLGRRPKLLGKMLKEDESDGEIRPS